MALYTQLDKKKLQQISHDYQLGLITDFEPLSGGSENSNYLVVTEKGKFVLTICEQKSVVEAKELAMILTHLDKHQFSTSKILKNSKNHAITCLGTKPLMVKKFIEGTVTEDLSEQHLYLLGIELGKLHQIETPKQIKQTTCYDRAQFTEVALYAPTSSFNDWLKTMKLYIDEHIDENAPKSLIHSDIFPSNVIISKDQSRVTIMDFEEAAHYYRMFDLGMTIIGSCRDQHQINLSKMTSLIKGYKTVVTLLEIEQRTLQAFTVYAGAAMTFWRHKNFHYTNPDPLLHNHYQELLKVTDFVKDLSPNLFI